LGVERLLEAETPDAPPAGRAPVPGHGVGDLLFADPSPPLRLPEFLSPVAAVLDELEEGGVGDGYFVYVEAGQIDLVRRALVVERPRGIVGPHEKRPGRDVDHLLLGWVRRGEMPAGFGPVALSPHELQRLEHGLVVLGLVLE